MSADTSWNSSKRPDVTQRQDARFRRFWLNLHLCIGIGLAILLVPISLSGALLVWHDHLDAMVNPGRYAVTQGQPQPPSALLAGARTALGPGYQLLSVRMPEDAGWPAVVTAREERREGSEGRPRVMTVHLDPPTAKILGVYEFRNTLVGFLHRFHENLTIPEYSGRAVVGWSGVGMLILSLTGIYLWWPRNAGFRRGLRWRRAPTTPSNLHHLFGFWISVPLAVVSATGIYLGFPQQGREWLSAMMPMSQPQRGGFNAPLLANPKLDIDRVARLAQQDAEDATPAAIFLPNRQAQTWRVQLRGPAGDATVLVDDRTSAVSKVTPLSGDRTAQWIRWLHEGSHSGVIWQILVFVCGILPTLFVITGTMIWLRSRRPRAAQLGPVAAPQAEAAE